MCYIKDMKKIARFKSGDLVIYPMSPGGGIKVIVSEKKFSKLGGSWLYTLISPETCMQFHNVFENNITEIGVKDGI
jgi:RNA polymerase-interacting CarD/CdnL/TRCF family regulator